QQQQQLHLHQHARSPIPGWDTGGASDACVAAMDGLTGGGEQAVPGRGGGYGFGHAPGGF
ncbi:hypothetical protein VTH06DRAFT_2378, partial [Thermothelomyces fergusii]